MNVVIDSNILFRIIISKGEILPVFFNQNFEIFTPLKHRDEFLAHKDELITKSGLSAIEFQEFIEILFVV